MKLDEQTKEIMTNEIDLKILEVLLDCNYSLTELAKEVGIAYKNLLPHVRKLENAGWVKTKKQKNTRGQRVIVSSGKYDWVGLYGLKDIFKGKIWKKLDREILEVIKNLNKNAEIVSIIYLANLSSTPNGIWAKLTNLIERGYIKPKFELTQEGEGYLDKLNKKYKK